MGNKQKLSVLLDHFYILTGRPWSVVDGATRYLARCEIEVFEKHGKSHQCFNSSFVIQQNFFTTPSICRQFNSFQTQSENKKIYNFIICVMNLVAGFDDIFLRVYCVHPTPSLRGQSQMWCPSTI